MRPITTQSKNRSAVSHAKSTATLHELKKTTQNFPALRNDFIVERYSRASLREGKGKLRLGSIARPAVVLSREERLNPWGKRSVISEEMVARKGLLELLQMGVIAKQFDCMQLLNNRYEPITPKLPQPQQPPPQEREAFMTNPALIDAYYERTKLDQTQEEKAKEIESRAIRKRSSTKKKVVKQEEPRYEFLIEDKVKLTVLNYHIQHNDTYLEYIKRLKRNGLHQLFKIYAGKVEEFAARHGLKKLTVIPELNETRKITEKVILSSIVNHKLYGIDCKVKGSSLQIFRWLLLAKVGRMRLRRMQAALKRIQKVKNQFKIKKFYQEMIDKRWKYVKFKLGSFAENQRRLVADNLQRNFRPEVEIHILASNATPEELQTYYKWDERKKAQLTRLYNNESDHIILIVRGQESLEHWLEDIRSAPSSWKKPRIHVFSASLPSASIQEYADIYFGLQPQHIRDIKRICDGKTAVVVPFFISPYLPHICETLQVSLFAGTFTEESRGLLFEEEEEEQPAAALGSKFTRLGKNSRDMNIALHRKFRQVTLACSVFQSKARAKQLFLELRLPTPVSLSMEGMNERDFFRELVRTILTHKQLGRWVLKLPDSTFSRGLAFLETESLKIIKEAKKRPGVREEDVEQIAKIIEAILVQKLSIPHNSLMNGDEFVCSFKEKQGYLEGLLENCASLCLFGRIETSGVLVVLGSYKKVYAEGVCFGALYPAEQLTEEMVAMARAACGRLYQQGVFGYVTFEVLLSEKSGEFFFIDLVPHLEQYSSFYFYYRRLLDINELDSAQFSNRLKRCLFYCPFVDNNGNRFASFKQLQECLQDRKLLFDHAKLEGFKYLCLSEEGPGVLSLLSCAGDEGGALRWCLQGLRVLVESGGEFNKFDKKFKKKQSDGLYIMDMLWRLRQMRKESGDK